jgi:transmembrane sensor
MSREIFHDLLEKYNKGLCTDAEKRIVEKWYGLLDAQDTVFEPEELSSLEQKLWNKINLKIIQEESASPSLGGKASWSVKKTLAVAAMICLTIILLVLFRQPTKDQNATFLADNAPALRTFLNSSPYPQMIELEDGSRVTLEPMARLTFPAHFKNSVREVSLDGDGFFLISKNPNKPFFVYNKHVVTRVLGTSFSIRLNPTTNETEVTVKTGKVLVTLNCAVEAVEVPVLFTKPKEVTLIPNEKTIYSVSDEGFNTTLADNPVPVPKIHGSAKPLSSRFNDALVKDVIACLMETYGIEIILKTDALKDMTFTGDLSALNLYNKLDFLCQSIDAQYYVEGTHIIIAKK